MAVHMSDWRLIAISATMRVGDPLPARRLATGSAVIHSRMRASLVSVSAATPIEEAVTLMTEYGFHHLPVVDEERPVGMLGLRQATRQMRARTGIGLGL
jgi:CBS domain-containing protein